jgi:Domain of unknown function (DUF1906)
MVVKQATPLMKGFDVNQNLSMAEAANFFEQGFQFVVRYIPRTAALVAGNLTPPEIISILNSGLALSVVQHVSEDNWMPTGELGTSYGEYASTYAKKIGLPAGMHIWLDLEMVNTSATVEDVKDYCQNWYNEVQATGYLAGLYVGWQVILTPGQLYDLPFKAYWRGYNADIPVATRGYQILQSTQKTLNGITYDPNTVQKDELGDLPMFLFPS